MTIREEARRFGRDIQCHRNVAYALVTRDSTMQRAVQALSRPEQSALMQWLTRLGPFWEDVRQHSGLHDLLAYNGKVVTDTAVGEAAFCIVHGIDRGLVSLNPSSWLTSPLFVTWYEENHERNINVPNYWDPNSVKAALASAPVPLGSWRSLESVANARYPDLTFSDASFEPLDGHPFGKSTAERVLVLLSVLQTLKNCFDERGERTPEGHALYQEHFTGETAWFSDSSDREKARFRSGLTFPHPTNAGEWLLCTWHGKVRTHDLRVHFSWPIRADEPLYITYIGPKITKQ